MLITNLNSEHPLIYNFKVKKYVGPYDFGLVNQNKRIWNTEVDTSCFSKIFSLNENDTIRGMSRNLQRFIFFKRLSILVWTYLKWKNM